MPHKRRFVASMDEVRISRDGDHAVIEYADPQVSTTQIKFGKEQLQAMSNQEILDLLNSSIEAQKELRTTLEFPAVEIPPGKPQIRDSQG